VPDSGVVQVSPTTYPSPILPGAIMGAISCCWRQDCHARFIRATQYIWSRLVAYHGHLGADGLARGGLNRCKAWLDVEIKVPGFNEPLITDVPFKSFVASFITYTTRSVLFLPRTPSLAISTPPSLLIKYLNFLLLPDIMAQNTNIAIRVIIVTLKSPFVGIKTSDIAKKLGCFAR